MKKTKSKSKKMSPELAAYIAAMAEFAELSKVSREAQSKHARAQNESQAANVVLQNAYVEWNKAQQATNAALNRVTTAHGALLTKAQVK